ncbi:MAG: 30S ribosomal protein S20 [Lachnospiraceae bacterium]|nr:30S ribosomal protein S20 [Lachnospiraceae bacterium]
MANIKSAKKRVITSAKRAERNKSQKSAVKTSIKKVYAAIDANDKAAAADALKAAIGLMEKAGSKGLFHRGTVSRKVSRLTKAVNKLG